MVRQTPRRREPRTDDAVPRHRHGDSELLPEQRTGDHPEGHNHELDPRALLKPADVHQTEGAVHITEGHQDTQHDERSGYRHCKHHPGKRSGGVAHWMIRDLRCPWPLLSLSTLGVVAAWFRHCRLDPRGYDSLLAGC